MNVHSPSVRLAAGLVILVVAACSPTTPASPSATAEPVLETIVIGD